MRPMLASEPEERQPLLTTGILLILVGGLVYSLRETLSPIAVGLCALIVLFCVWRGIPTLLAVAFIAGILMASWVMDGILAVLRPIGIGAVVAYLFGPLVRRLEAPLRTRTGAILAVMAAIFVLIGGMGMVVLPRLLSEIAGLVRHFPDYSARMKDWYAQALMWSTPFGVGERVETLRQRALEDLPGLGQAALEYLGGRLAGFLTQAAGLLDLLIVPFVAFYLLKDGARILDVASRLIPSRRRRGALGLIRKVDDVLGEYVRGQVIVCGIVAALTSAGLAICGIPYALLLGGMAGLLNVVPYVGLLTTLGASAVVALFDPSPASALLRVLAVFGVVQGLEGNLITPKIVGERVGLHPLWVILAMTVFSRMWGLPGMVAAVPIAATLNVLVRTAAEAYYQSEFYRRES